MNRIEITELLDYFTRYSSDKECVSYYHREWDSFKMCIYNDTEEVYQLNTDHEPFGVELKTLEEFKTRFTSFTGEKVEDISRELENKISMLENKIELLKEDLECVQLYLDDMEVARYDITGLNKYSIVGRIKELLKTKQS